MEIELPKDVTIQGVKTRILKTINTWGTNASFAKEVEHLANAYQALSNVELQERHYQAHLEA